MWVVSIRTEWKNVKCALVCMSLLCFYRDETTKKTLVMISKFYFLHVLFSFMSQSLVLKKSSFKMLVVFSPIYVTDKNYFPLWFRSSFQVRAHLRSLFLFFNNTPCGRYVFGILSNNCDTSFHKRLPHRYFTGTLEMSNDKGEKIR